MWSYRQSTGEFFDNDMRLITVGYSGNGDGKNNPDMEGWVGVGCIPCGLYSIEKGVNKSSTGVLSLPLIPKEGDSIYGRSSFYIHVDSIIAPGTASKGCPILNNKIMSNEDRVNELCVKYPDFEIEIKIVYNSIKEYNKSLEWLEFALKSNIDLKIAEEFFLKNIR
jgi:hypothetical protein